ncbi:hypothetical protein ABNJ92_004594 [Vibrio parahaemolyticus]
MKKLLNTTRSRSSDLFLKEGVRMIDARNVQLQHSAYIDLHNEYNQLVEKYNELIDAREAESFFLQGILESSPYSPEEKMIRGFNVSIYLSNEKNKDKAEEAISEILNCLGYEAVYEAEKFSSWLKKITTRSKKLLSEEDVKKDIRNIKAHIENTTVKKSQSENDLRLAEAVAKLAEASGDDECIHIIGSLVFVKFYGNDRKLKTISKSLTTEELQILATDQSLLSQPAEFFQLLGEQTQAYLNSDTEIASGSRDISN